MTKTWSHFNVTKTRINYDYTIKSRAIYFINFYNNYFVFYTWSRITWEKNEIKSWISRSQSHSWLDAPFGLACGRSCAQQKLRTKEGLKRERKRKRDFLWTELCMACISFASNFTSCDEYWINLYSLLASLWKMQEYRASLWSLCICKLNYRTVPCNMSIAALKI